MRNLWQFIINNIHLLLFLLLEVVAFLLITHYQPYPKSTLITSANQLVAGVNETGDNVAAYFHLRQDNDALNSELANLQMQMQDLQNQLEYYQETSALPDSTRYHYAHLGYQVIPAKVIDLTTHQEHNYLTLNKGLRDGVQSGMGVIANGSVVGVVNQVNDYFSLVVPIIHTNINISARIHKTDQIGFTHWLGHDIRHVQLMEIGRHVLVSEGDTVLTSGITATFPEGLMVGVMDRVNLDEGDNYYNIRLRLTTDFHHLRYVQILNNTLSPQLDSLYNE
ncbi:MAG: rod shape-determining protein MreC [Paludibacteraceae bacterium]|nr:rod shape-determining protein MreC [Paludibacteraceae bacterium]